MWCSRAHAERWGLGWPQAVASLRTRDPCTTFADPEGEYEEMRLKARALLRAVGECDSGDPAAAADVAD